MHDRKPALRKSLVAYIDDLARKETKLVSTRDSPEEVIEWALEAVPREQKVLILTAVLMMQNTMMKIIGEDLKELVNPNQETKVSS